MTPFSDARVHDRVVLDEIELYGELVIAASSSDGPLSTAQIDAVLGLKSSRAGKRPRGVRPRGRTPRPLTDLCPEW